MISLWFRLTLCLIFCACFVSELGAIPRNPPPVFESDYTLPATSAPQPKNPLTAENFTAVGIYSVFLILAALAVHRWRSRKTLFLLAIAAVTLFGFVRQGCPCPVGMFQNIVDALIHPVPFIPWTVILLFTIPLLVALFWGRVFCSSVCPFGAVQELTTIKNLRIPDGVEQAFGLFRFFWLGLGVFFVVLGLGYWVCRFDLFVGFFRFSGLYPVLIFGGIVLVIGFFIGRPFCRFLCPYGALLGLCGSLAAKKVSVTPGECTKCQLCENVCPYNAILKPTVTPIQQERRTGPRRLLAAVVVLPLLITFFAFLGYRIAPKLAPLHRDVRTAELLFAEDQKLVDAFGTFPETRGVIQTGIPYEDVYLRALTAFQRFRIAGLWLGVWFGAVIGIKLISLTLRRSRTDYEVDPGRCFACGRCFWYCPNQKEKRLLLK
jgi:ferredoxin